MNYSSSIRSFLKELARLKSYSRIHPVLRIITAILMLPFIALAAAGVILFYVILFLRNESKISIDELELWLDKRREGIHCAPEAVLYFVTMPFIFFLRVLMTVFSGILYLTWFEIMCSTYVATLGGIRWQPYLNCVNYDIEYAWSFKYSKNIFNVFAIANIGLVILCVVQYFLAKDGLSTWLAALTVFMVYIVYPNIFTKKNMCDLDNPEAIYAEAIQYAEVRCLANYTRAISLVEQIPEHEDAGKCVVAYQSYVARKRNVKNKVNIILMIIAAVLIVTAVVAPIIADAVIDSVDHSDHLVYYEEDWNEYSVSCNSYGVINVKIKEAYRNSDVVFIRDSAFDGCTKLRSVEIPATVKGIGSYAFRDCESLEEIIYEGTISEWLKIVKSKGWDNNIGNYVVICTDGTYNPSYYG